MTIDLSGPQAFIESELFGDECTIWVEDVAARYLDTVSGEVVAGATTTFYDGACMVTGFGAADESDVGGVRRTARTGRVSIPVDAPEVPRGARVEITAAMNDPQLVGRTYVVTDVRASSFSVMRRLTVEEHL